MKAYATEDVISRHVLMKAHANEDVIPRSHGVNTIVLHKSPRLRGQLFHGQCCAAAAAAVVVVVVVV